MDMYAAKFESFSRHFRFYREEVDEKIMCHCFQNGLKYEIKDSVLPLGIQRFQVLVEKCIEIEYMKNKRANRGGNFSFGGPSQVNHHNNKGKQVVKPYNQPHNNNRDQNHPGNQNFGRQLGQVIQYFRCGEGGHYANACTSKSLTCYNYQKSGHFARDCKAPKVEPIVNAIRATHPTAKGRIYFMGVEAGNPSSNLIQRDSEIASNTLAALFDSGATHSFIVMDCVNRLKLIVSSLSFDLDVSTLTKTLTVNIACLRCQVTIHNRDFLINLIFLPLQLLEVILDMDWMSYHYVILDCACKLVLFFEPGVVMYLAVNKLANVEGKINVSIEDVVLAKEYPEVFPTEIPELSPVREVEFFIDLHTGTRPISIAPYRMSPLELNELKGQI
ncbi:uncharacterized protein [Cicer arietinum]|uniref:Uncharacterized protein LOC101497718 n=1 Tax=Cicer arietinum TaxID=3827 RepID=A0A1S2Z482_CICAR|nr:uncharacterized protein LOC101497718 [Cicer arietinum]